MRCDGRTFTEAGGGMVSEEADRAVNRSANTEQINVSQKCCVCAFTTLVSQKKMGCNRCHVTLSKVFLFTDFYRYPQNTAIIFLRTRFRFVSLLKAIVASLP